MKYLEKLRTKPEGYRNRFALIAAAVLTLVIAAIWLSTNQVLTFKKAVDEVPTPTTDTSPFENLKKSFTQFSDNFSKNVSDLTDKFKTGGELQVLPASTTEATTSGEETNN